MGVRMRKYGREENAVREWVDGGGAGLQADELQVAERDDEDAEDGKSGSVPSARNGRGKQPSGAEGGRKVTAL